MPESWRSKVRLWTWLENNPYDRTDHIGVTIPAQFYVVRVRYSSSRQAWGISRHLVLHPNDTYAQMQAAFGSGIGILTDGAATPSGPTGGSNFLEWDAGIDFSRDFILPI